MLMSFSFLFRWKVKFICSLCYKNGQISEATKDLKYCSARAQHSWATNKKTVLVQTIRKDWTQIRDLPYLKNKVREKFDTEFCAMSYKNGFFSGFAGKVWTLWEYQETEKMPIFE